MTRQFAALCRVLDLDGIATDPPFATNEARVANRASLTALITERTSRRLKAELIAALEDAGVPGGPINTVAGEGHRRSADHGPRDLHIAPAGLPGVRTPIALLAERPAAGKGGPPPRRWRLAFPHIKENGGKAHDGGGPIDGLGRVKGLILVSREVLGRVECLDAASARSVASRALGPHLRAIALPFYHRTRTANGPPQKPG